MSDLKLCPFCGGKAIIEKHSEWDWAQYEVKCTKCNCGLSAYYTYQKAVEAWNRRAERVD